LHNIDSFPFNKALITGGAGFVGSHLAESLIRAGVKTTILDNFSSGFESNVSHEVTLVRGDVRDREVVKQVVKGIDIIFHLAEYIPNYPGHVIRYSAKSPREDLDVCVGGTINLLEAARKNSSAFVLSSTAAVYGSRSVPLSENSPLEPISPYGAAKLCAEAYTLLYRRSYNVPTMIFRFFNLYGPRQRKYLMYDCLLKMKQNPSKVELLGNGKEVRDYIYVKDAINLLLSLLDVEDDVNPIFNIGTGIGRTTLEVAHTLAKQLSIAPRFEVVGDSWSGNSSCLLADMSKVRRHIAINFSDYSTSLKSVVSWFSGGPNPQNVSRHKTRQKGRTGRRTNRQKENIQRER